MGTLLGTRGRQVTGNVCGLLCPIQGGNSGALPKLRLIWTGNEQCKDLLMGKTPLLPGPYLFPDRIYY